MPNQLQIKDNTGIFSSWLKRLTDDAFVKQSTLHFLPAQKEVILI